MNPRPQAVITMDHYAALLEAGGVGHWPARDCPAVAAHGRRGGQVTLREWSHSVADADGGADRSRIVEQRENRPGQVGAADGIAASHAAVEGRAIAARWRLV